MKIRLVLWFLMLIVPGGLRADPISVAILGSPFSAVWNDDVQAKLLSTGFFSAVDIYNISSVTPSLAQLMAYDSALVYSDILGYADSAALGDNLADYVDAGGGVVLGVFANASIAFGGRFASDGYWGIIPTGQSAGPQLTLGTILEPGSPLVEGVLAFDGGTSSYRSNGPLDPGAVVVAEWSNGDPLIVRRTIGGVPRVDLNFFPPSSDERSNFWNSSTDGARLMANALVYTAAGKVEVVPEPGTFVLVLGGLAGLAGLARRGRSGSG